MLHVVTLVRLMTVLKPTFAVEVTAKRNIEMKCKRRKTFIENYEIVAMVEKCFYS